MTHLLNEIYRQLFQAFGHRHWWPGESREEVIIGAILTQNVAWRNVSSAIENLRKHRLLTLADIHRANLELIASLIMSTRFFHQKARKLKNFTGFLFTNYSGSLDEMFARPTCELRKELLSINGLGEETADSILLYAGGKAVFVVDAYTKRIFSRMGITSEEMTYQEYQAFFMSALKPDAGLYNDYHAQIVYLGHHYCKAKNPACDKCPIRRLCRLGGATLESTPAG